MAGRTSTPAPKKRTRSQNEEEPASTASKKRRLRSAIDTPTTTRTLQRQSPEPAPTTNAPSGRKRRVPAAQSAPVSQDASTDAWESWEVPASDDEQRQPNRGRTTPKKLPASATSQKVNVYDVPESGEDEISTPVVTPRAQRQRPGVAVVAKDEGDVAPLTNGDESAKRKRGRPRKQDRKVQHEAQKRVAPVANMSASPSPPPDQRPGTPSRESPQIEDEEPQSEAAVKDSPTPKTRRPRGVANGRLEEGAQLPKGILTPRKGGNGADRRRKSVAFDDGADEEALEGLAAESPSKSTGKRRQPAAKEVEVEVEVADEMELDREPEADEKDSEEGSDDEEEDDEVCAICSKPDSKKGNLIIFCDNCDVPVHQKCYGLAKIPEGDWICRDCSQESVGGVSRAKASVVAQEDQTPDIPNFDQHLRSMQRVLLDRCAGRRRIKLRGQDEAYKKTQQLVEQTIVAGEGNSMLVIGGRGCGKTTLVESVISEMGKHHKDQFHVVRLNGFIHTDDKLALREIWRQLGKEMKVEDELVKISNHADTMQSLLSLLSHPSEIAATQDGLTSKSIVFVIDEFDLFATHARQTLLYNLFDIAQARKAPIAVLGLTTRIDVVESLEKRVKSRFSHRYVYLSLPTSVPAYWDICRQGLSVDDEDMVQEGIDPTLQGHRAFWDWWNERIEALHKTRGFTDQLESHFYSTKSASAFLTTCTLPLASLTPTAPSLQIPAVSTTSLDPPDSSLHLLGALSDLDLSLLIAAARLDIVAHTDTVNFAMAYDEYTSLMGRQRVQSASAGMLALGGGARVWGRGVAGIAWERLVALGLLVPAAAGGRGTAGLGGLDAKMWKVDVALEEIPAAAGKLNAVLARWCREI